jgi:ABC-type uncharacterized transport system involved in gliding motility auxiliary subunit/ABC-type transport system involved in multi-copper enzyme maturation permease subunit
MRNFWVIFLREMKAYFNSPIAYIFVIVFVALTCGLYMASFFLAERADMRPFFGLLPVVLMVFVPAISMRLWAEDKKMGTIELLLTFPMKSWQILLGKFLASFLFLTVALAGTVTVPIIIRLLGRPDWGPIIGGYVGSLLLGAFFLSVGVFISGLCKDQIVAFILAAIACFFFFFIGTDFFTAIIGGWLGGIATFMGNYLGLTRHFEAIQRGVIDIRALVYFMSMSILFLSLNAIYLEGRLRPKAKLIFLGVVGLLSVAAVMINVVMAGVRGGRLDLTEGKMFTVSDSAKKVLKGLKDAVQVKYYVSSARKLPAPMKTLQQDVTDKLEEFRIASNNMLQYKAYDPSEEPALIEKIGKKGIQPFVAQTIARDEFSTKVIYSAIMISYAEKEDEIIAQVTPDNFNNLEYELISKIYRLTLSEKPVVALHAPMEEPDPRMTQMYMRMGQPPPPARDNFRFLEQALRGEGFDVSRIKLDKGDSISEKAKCVLIVNPKELDERQRYEINRAVVEGKNVLLAVQNYVFDYRPSGSEGIVVMPEEVKPQVNDLIKEYGVTVDEQFLMDRSLARLSIPSRRTIGGFISMEVRTPVDIPIQILVTDQNMNHEVSITDRLDSVLYLWGTRLNISEDRIREAGLKHTVLMTSSEKSWVTPFHPTPLTREDIVPLAEKYDGKQPLMVMLSGQFPDVFKGKNRPEWPEPKPEETPPRPRPDEEEEPEKPLNPRAGKLIVLGCAETFTDNFIQSGGNGLLASNVVDALALGEELINIRSKQFTDRSIKKTSAGKKLFYRFLTMGLVPVVFIGIGLTRYVVVRKGKERYLRSLASA